MELSMEPTTIPNWSMYMVDVKNRFGVEQLRNMGCGYAPRSQYWPLKHTVRNLHFLSKNSTLISRENCRFFWMKNSWKCCGFGLFSCWQLWFHEKNCQKNLGEKLVKMLGVCQNWIFGQKFDFSNSVPRPCYQCSQLSVILRNKNTSVLSYVSRLFSFF